MLHGESTHEASFTIGSLFGRALAFIDIFGPFLLRHICFCPMVFGSTATNTKQEHKENDAPLHVAAFMRPTWTPHPLSRRTGLFVLRKVARGITLGVFRPIPWGTNF